MRWFLILKFYKYYESCLYYIGEEEKEEVKDAVEDEPNFEDAPQEDAFAEDEDEQLEQEDENGKKCF